MANSIMKLSVRDVLQTPSVWITIILFLGFVFAPGAADVAAIKQGVETGFAGGKLVRVLTVLLACLIALTLLFHNNVVNKLLKGNLGIVFSFSCLAFLSVVFSELKTMTIYKSFEMVVALLIAATLYRQNDPYKNSIKYLVGIFWLYIITAIGVYIQLAYFGPGAYKQVHSTPLLSFMLSSKYPPLAANSLGLLGAFIAMYGLYLLHKYDVRKMRIMFIGLFIGFLGGSLIILSYTRSVMVFTLLAAFIFLYYRRSFLILSVAIISMLAVLTVDDTRSLLERHSKRGDSVQNIETLSSRSIFWKSILERDMLRLMVGNGYATGTLFQSYSNAHNRGKIFKARNAHNSIFEIINSVGIIGAIIWIALILRILMQLIKHHYRSRQIINDDERLFHLLITCVFILCALRSFMNSTFVYLDYFLPFLLAVSVYADSLAGKRKSACVMVDDNSEPDSSEISMGSSGVLNRGRGPMLLGLCRSHQKTE